MMKLTQHQAAAGVALRAALAALLLAVALPAPAQSQAEPAPAAQQPPDSDLLAKEMFAALVTAFQSYSGAEVQVQHFVRNELQQPQPQAPKLQVPSPLGVEQVRVAPGMRLGAGASGLPQADTSASCQGDNASAECMLPGQATTDWRKQTGIELDPISGAPLIPGVTLNPTGH